MDQIQGPQQWLLLLFDEYEWREQEVVQLILRFEAILVLGFGIVAPSIGEEDAERNFDDKIIIKIVLNFLKF